MSASKVALQEGQRSSRRKTPKTMSADVSPDSKCPICLDIFNNMSYLDRCLHKFCFRCIQEWAKNKAECPLCKQPFNSIYHSIKSEQDFKQYDLRPTDNGSFGTFGGERFRYRTTLTGVNRQMQRRTSPPPDNGVLFEPSRNSSQQPQDRYVRRMMMRLVARRKAAIEGRPVNNIAAQEMINFRRELYRQGVRVRTVRDGGRSRDTSAEFYKRNPACLHRLIPWLKRELTVLYGGHGSLVNLVQHIIMSRITCYDLEDVGIQEQLRPFLQGRTEHFLHEFISFARAPFNMEAYDQNAVYECQAPSSNEDSSSNSSVIAISEDEEHAIEPTGDPTSTLSHSMWDDETPGPSYSTTAERGRIERLSILTSDSDSSLEEEALDFPASPQHMSPQIQANMARRSVNNEECLSPNSDDCVIVGFVKPTAERTPELVQLSSDSDEFAIEDGQEIPFPVHIRFPSVSPPASQCSDLNCAGVSQHVEMDLSQVHPNTSSPTTSSKHKTSKSKSKRSREKHLSKGKDHRKRRTSKSRDYRHTSRSPVVLSSIVSNVSKEKGYSYSSSRDLYSKYDSNSRRKDTNNSYQSYSHYSEEKDDRGMYYTERRSYYYTSHKYSERHSYSRSRSHSRNSHRRVRRCSRSRSISSSRSTSKRRSHRSKPGGKRKYKTRHLEEPSAKPKNTISKLHSEDDSSVVVTKHKKRSKEKHRKKSKEGSRRTSRSTSVELVSEENSYERSKHHHKKKKKHKKKSKRHKNNERSQKCPAGVITIESDGDFADDNVTHSNSTNMDIPVDNATDGALNPVESSPMISGS